MHDNIVSAWLIVSVPFGTHCMDAAELGVAKNTLLSARLLKLRRK